MFKELFLGLALWLTSAALAGTSSICDTGDGHADGCTIPFGLPFPYKKRFTKSCNRHDVCYYCGKTRGVSRLNCDKYFYANMRKTCEWWNASCYEYALTYYLAVRVGAKSYWKDSRSWCGQSWVPGCMK